MAIAKKVSNEDVMRRLGDYLHIEDTMFRQAQGNGAKARGKGRSVVANNAVQGEGYVYTKLNNIFVDLINYSSPWLHSTILVMRVSFIQA